MIQSAPIQRASGIYSQLLVNESDFDPLSPLWVFLWFNFVNILHIQHDKNNKKGQIDSRNLTKTTD